MTSLPETIYLKNVPSPLFYMDHKCIKHEFKRLESTTKTHLINLLQYVAPEANLNLIPSFKKFHCNDAHLSVLNYTNDRLIFSKNRRLYINNMYVTSFTKDNCRVIAYKTAKLNNLTCLEIKDDNKLLPQNRRFILNLNNTYKWIRTPQVLSFSSLIMGCNTEKLITQIPFEISDINKFINENLCMKNLITKIPREASLKNTPKLIQFRPREDLPRFTILNYTPHTITLNILKNFLINQVNVTYFDNQHCQVIAYHLDDNPELICFLQQDENMKDSGPPFFAKVSWIRSDEAFFKNTINEIHTKLAYSYLWKSFYDDTSLFSKNGVSKDIVATIIKTYLSLNLNLIAG